MRLERAGRLMHASHIPPEKLDLVDMPDGRRIQAIRTVVPNSYNFESGEFEDGTGAVVCAASIARMAILRGLTRHPELSYMQRCHAWVYEEGEGGPMGEPYGGATKDLEEAVRRKGSDLRAWVYDLGEPVPPFEPLPFQPHQYRSRQPAEFYGAYEITGADWPSGLATIPPFDCYKNYEELAADIIGRCCSLPPGNK